MALYKNTTSVYLTPAVWSCTTSKHTKPYDSTAIPKYQNKKENWEIRRITLYQPELSSAAALLNVPVRKKS